MSIFRVISSRLRLALGPAGAVMLLANACSPGPLPISRSSHDPSSPSAPEGANPAAVAIAAPMRPAPPAEGTGSVVYACPMHPEVTSETPGGVCPKCNMKLVPKK